MGFRVNITGGSLFSLLSMVHIFPLTFSRWLIGIFQERYLVCINLESSEHAKLIYKLLQ